ncbi:MAG: DUF3095 family protein [Calothrix sp. C42_A2020_038]|nr:DUF3095 family protein [Calothrix sp. C42_A2020_038]
MSNFDFYDQLNTFRNFKDFTNLDFYLDAPSDWYIVITDIVNSTKAIATGEYKHVNMASALSLIAVINLNPNQKLPFIFGGDGITLLVPRPMLSDVKSVLSDNRDFVQNNLHLKLRVGCISIQEIYKAGYELKIGKYQISSKYSQMIIIGNGIDYAEYIIKNDSEAFKYLVPENYQSHVKADYSGFACPFEDFTTNKEEILSLIIKVRGNNFQKQRHIYQEILSKMEFIFGAIEECHPLSSTMYFKLASEKTNGAEILMKISLLRKDKLIKYLAWLILKISFYLKRIQMNILFIFTKFKKNIINSSDYKKFDGSLKMTISSYTEQRNKFQTYLQNLEKEGKIYFGLHISNRALVICLIGNQEVHLVDAADGGYALAAKQIKQKTIEIKNYY